MAMCSTPSFSRSSGETPNQDPVLVRPQLLTGTYKPNKLNVHDCTISIVHTLSSFGPPIKMTTFLSKTSIPGFQNIAISVSCWCVRIWNSAFLLLNVPYVLRNVGTESPLRGFQPALWDVNVSYSRTQHYATSGDRTKGSLHTESDALSERHCAPLLFGVNHIRSN